MKSVTLIYPYYENPAMLARQVENWNRFSGTLREHLKIILVDDGSPEHPAFPIFSGCQLAKRLYRIQKNIPFGMHHARNVGAFEANKESDAQWLFFSDIDIMLTPETASSLFERKLDLKRLYTFGRVFASDRSERKPHCNTFLVRSKVFWRVNGYDVDFVSDDPDFPNAKKRYGGDREMMRQLTRITPAEHLPDVILLSYTNDVVADADTRDWSREECKINFREVYEAKRKKGDMRSKNPIRWSYERLI